MEESVERLLVEILDRPEQDWTAALDASCKAHPNQAITLRRRMQTLMESGIGAPAPTTPPPDQLGDFRLVRRLGEGGMGVVYLAVEEPLGREVALKVVRPEHLHFAGARERFRREVEATAKLEHDGIVPIYRFVEDAEVPFFTMALVRGHSLARVLERLRGRSPAQLDCADIGELFEAGGDQKRFGRSWIEFCVHTTQQTARALQHAHERGVLHRDIKPSNLMLRNDGSVRILDFGLALHEGDQRMTKTGSTLGSLPYLAPERLRAKTTDRRSDVYGLGVTFYELLTLQSPFLDHDPEETRRRIAAGHPPRPSLLNAAVPWEVETVCLKAMDIDPARRYESAAMFAEDLENILQLRPIQARRPSVPLRTRRWTQRHPTWAAVLILGLLALVGGPLILWIQARSHAHRLAKENRRVWQVYDEFILADRMPRHRGDLGPTFPGDPEAVRVWLDQARRLVDRETLYKDRRAKLRLHALPRSKAERQADAARRKRREATIQDLETALATVIDRGEPGVAIRWQEWMRKQIAIGRQDLQERYTWTFEDPEDAWYYRSAGRILAGIRELKPILARVGAQQASREAAFSPAEQEVWRQTIEEVAIAPIYKGLRLEPQKGLLPIGRDPDSRLFEFAHRASGNPAQRDRQGRLVITPDTGIVLVLLPSARFVRGARPPHRGERSRKPNVDPDAFPEEGPPRPLRLHAFFLAKHELTQAQWKRLTGTNPSYSRPPLADHAAETITALHPVETVSWRQCSDALAAVGLALPTEAQWEYAARAKTRSPWWTGWTTASLEGCANLLDQTALRRRNAPNLATRGFFGIRARIRDFATFDDGHATHAEVTAFRPNAFGFLNILGNVAEWCSDSQAAYLGPGEPGTGKVSMATEPITFRGGSYLSPPYLARSSFRGCAERDTASDHIGVRAARPLD